MPTSPGTKGAHLTRFLNYNRSGPSCCDQGPGTGNVYVYSGAPWGPQLGEVMVTNSRGSSRYRGLTLGLRKRLSHGYQVEGNYMLAKDEDDDSNERDPFTDRSFNFFDLRRTGARPTATSGTSSTRSATSRCRGACS